MPLMLTFAKYSNTASAYRGARPLTSLIKRHRAKSGAMQGPNRPDRFPTTEQSCTATASDLWLENRRKSRCCTPA